MQHALFERDDRVPFRFRWLDGRMVVTDDDSGRGLFPRGSEVLAIDRVPVPRLLAKMTAMARADGGNDAKRRDLLQVRGTERYETFDVYLSLLLPGEGGTRSYRLRVPGRRPGEVRAESLTHAARLARRSVVDERGQAPVWSLELDDPALAVLRMPTWALYSSRWDWQAFLQQGMATLVERKVPALVIDLRDNEGGMDVGDVLLAHLVDAPQPLAPIRRLVRYRAVPPALAPYLDTWDPSFKDWGDAAVPYDGRFYLLQRPGVDDAAASVQPRAPRYRGRVFVLIGPGNSSATFEFAQRARETGTVTLVGDTTGGNRRGINGGAFFFLRLPRTGLEMDLPLIGQFPVAAQPDAGIEPDVRAVATQADIAAGRDVGMATVRALLAGAPR